MQLTAMIFAASDDSHARIQRRCVSTGDFNILRSTETRPSAADMLRVLNSYTPELALIEVKDQQDAVEVEETLHGALPNLMILAFADNWLHDGVVKTARGQIKVLPTKLPLEAFQEAVLELVSSSKVPGPDNVIVFMPAKAGSGASTIALNVTGALANKCGKSTILVEADLHSGPAGLYLNLNSTYSVMDALQQSHRLDETWNDMITPVKNFSILPACNIRGGLPHPSPWAYRRLLSYTRQRYEYVIFDLPEVVNQATEAIVTSAKMVYVVCTPEVPSLMLARKRRARLIEHGVPADRLQIILNRYSKDGPDAAAIADILGYPIGQLIPNDYKSLWEANLKRQLVAENSVLGQALESFAWSLTGKVVAPPKIQNKIQKKLFGLFPAA